MRFVIADINLVFSQLHCADGATTHWTLSSACFLEVVVRNVCFRIQLAVTLLAQLIVILPSYISAKVLIFSPRGLAIDRFPLNLFFSQKGKDLLNEFFCFEMGCHSTFSQRLKCSPLKICVADGIF